MNWQRFWYFLLCNSYDVIKEILVLHSVAIRFVIWDFKFSFLMIFFHNLEVTNDSFRKLQMSAEY